MKIDSKALTLLIVGLVNSGLSVANGTTYTYTTYDCPSTVRLAPGATVIPKDVPEDYESLVPDSILHLSGYSLFDGPPKDRAQLKSSESSKGGVTTWTLTPGAYPLGVWISCDYAQGLVRIVKRARDPVASCTATSEKVKPYGSLAVRFDCKSNLR